MAGPLIGSERWIRTTDLQFMRLARTTELLYLASNLAWKREQDLNLRPFGYEPNELPDCSIPHQEYLFSTT